MNDSDSAALVQKIVDGDASAMMTLYDRTNRLLFGLVLRILPDGTPAEEALLEAYTRVWRQADGYSPRAGTPLAWMMALARTCAIEKMRAAASDKSRPVLSELAPGGEAPTLHAEVEAGDLSDAPQQLLRSAAEAAPPEYIRDLLALRIEREPRTKPAPASRPVEPEKIELKHTSPPRPVPAPAPVRQPRSRLVPWFLAITCAAAAALFFFLWRQTQKQADQAIQWERDAAHEARSEADRLRSMMDSSAIRRKEIDVLDAALASPGVSVVYLAARRPETPAAAVVLWDAKKNAWTVMGHLPPAPSGKEYQLWFVTASDRRSAGLIPVDALGHGFATIELPPNLPKLAGVEITLEPLGGSEQPTTPVVVSGKPSQTD